MSLGGLSTHRAIEYDTRRVGPAKALPPVGASLSLAVPSPTETTIARAVGPGDFCIRLQGIRGPAGGRLIARGELPDGRNKPTRLAASHARAGSARTVQ